MAIGALVQLPKESMARGSSSQTSERSGESIFGAPAPEYPSLERPRTPSEFFFPLRNSCAFPGVFNEPILAGVVALDAPGGPAAVPRFVIPVVVDAV